MTDTFGTQPAGPKSPTAGNTEFERSIARSSESSDGSDNSGSSLRETIDGDLDAVKQAAGEATRRVTEKASDLADRQKGYAADQIGRIAEALEKVGSEMQSKQPGAVGDYAKRLGVSARQFADRIEDKNIGEIATVAEDFGRRQPLAFLGLAAIAGLAASRFLMASSPKGSSPKEYSTAYTPGGSAQPQAAKEAQNG